VEMDKFEDHDDKKKVATAKSTYKNLPVYFTCPHCDYTGYTIVEQKTTFITYIIILLSVFLFHFFLSIVLMPLIILLTRNFSHKCPSCFSEVGSDNKLMSILDLTDKMISFNIGEFGIVLTRKIIMGVVLTLILIFTLYMKLDFLDGHHYYGPVIPVDVTWKDYLQECGKMAFYEHKAERILKCHNKYKDKTVQNWRGYVVRVEDLRQNMYNFSPHAILIMVKMDPSEREQQPDLYIAADTDKARQLNDLIVSLNRGGEIRFNASWASFGEDENMRHLHIVDLAKEDGYMEISELVHSHGRYSNQPKFLRGVINLPSTNALPAPTNSTSEADKQNSSTSNDNDNNTNSVTP